MAQVPARRGNSGRHHIGIVENEHRCSEAVLAQGRSQMRPKVEAFDLLQIGRLFDQPVAYDSGKTDSNGVDLLALPR